MEFGRGFRGVVPWFGWAAAQGRAGIVLGISLKEPPEQRKKPKTSFQAHPAAAFGFCPLRSQGQGGSQGWKRPQHSGILELGVNFHPSLTRNDYCCPDHCVWNALIAGEQSVWDNSHSSWAKLWEPNTLPGAGIVLCVREQERGTGSSWKAEITACCPFHHFLGIPAPFHQRSVLGVQIWRVYYSLKGHADYFPLIPSHITPSQAWCRFTDMKT